MSSFPQSMSKVKLVILFSLLDSGVGFPRDWVESSKLIYLTSQTNFERHVIELRDEMGCDIEITLIGGEKCYRLRSTDRMETKPKVTLEQSQKEALLLFANNSCQICGAKLIPGKKDLQSDLKVPAERGGTHDLSNWQLACNTCLVNKRRACAECEASCPECSWAFPEQIENMKLIRLPPELSQRLASAGIKSPPELERRIVALLERSLEPPAEE